ncbi:endonuclease III [Candidatus Uhrbacteria bacterium]|nr:endonuclease III [Candidatus Uhrbacteria bacterium]
MEAQKTKILATLKKQFPNPGAMELGDPYRTLTAVIFSARTRDEQVLKLLPAFFAAYPTVRHLALASPAQIQRKINTIGLYRQKAKQVSRMAREVVARFDGEIPNTMEELVSLSGVGRKTASVILVACFHTPAIAVDTHVHRVTNRLGWVKTKTPEKTEEALLKMIDKKWQSTVNRVFVKFGRSICLPGKPRCYLCPIRASCQFKHKNFVTPKSVEAIEQDIARREKELEALRQAV